jgi:hypothetical protein
MAKNKQTKKQTERKKNRTMFQLRHELLYHDVLGSRADGMVEALEVHHVHVEFARRNVLLERRRQDVDFESQIFRCFAYQ